MMYSALTRRVSAYTYNYLQELHGRMRYKYLIAILITCLRSQHKPLWILWSSNVRILVELQPSRYTKIVSSRWKSSNHEGWIIEAAGSYVDWCKASVRAKTESANKQQVILYDRAIRKCRLWYNNKQLLGMLQVVCITSRIVVPHVETDNGQTREIHADHPSIQIEEV